MTKWVECVPNVVEGRKPATIDAIAGAIAAVPGVHLLDTSSDIDHNRTVFTFAGAPKDVVEGAWACIDTATRLIRKPQEDGVHPWRGAVDVVPFVPLSGCSLEECARLARSLAERVTQCEVALYGAASLSGESLPDVRRRLSGRRDVVTIGAREVLLAYNVQLESSDYEEAQAIAREVRELPAVRALAFPLASRGCVQVSMNLLDWRTTSPRTAFRAVRRLAEARGIEVRDSEFVGMVPREAVEEGFTAALRCAPVRLLDATPEFLEALAARSPAPAGASAAAMAGAMAAALLVMTAREQGTRAEADALRLRLRKLADEDGVRFAAHLAARDEESLYAATECPVRIAEACARILTLADAAKGMVAPPMAPDLRAGLLLARTGLQIAAETARGNMSHISDDSRVAELKSRIDSLFSA